ncbi:PH domain-containing protein [Agromyces sp. H3Y2-19a]|jgi:membrane protein YdbS with pleckstrin-like domain|uniref:PH domain-containing protein n=1 Tax=Agromyces TaxID=33877 RepID=UPI001E5C2494|nr:MULTISPECIES: PH domain-containing protein [Agromyces]MCD5347798.1 PH domain-containing protein [Agromyces sp. S2-1-8]MDF0514616.1 PH domain-containing protein [Agromyces chromiiresistens]
MTRADAPVTAAPTVPPERVVARLRRHARVLILPVLLLIAVSAASGYAVGLVDESWQLLAIGAGALLVIVLGCLLPYLAWLTGRTTITTRRIIMRRGVFVRVRNEIAHARVREVTVRKTPGQSMFGSGDVRIDVGHEEPVVLRDLPKPQLVQSALHELMEDAHRTPFGGAQVMPGVLDGDTVAWGGR